MRFLVIAAALLSLLGSIDARALSTTSKPSHAKLEEIMRRLMNCTEWCEQHQAVCNEQLVQQVIPEHNTKLTQTEVFRKAAAALQKVEAAHGDLKTKLGQLCHQLTVNAPRGITVKYTVDNDVQISLHMFLKSLLNFSRQQYNQLGVTTRQ